MQYLFRDARRVEFTCLDGGFSGNVVLKAKAKDKLGHYQVPSVIKIGKREPISKERIAFERIQEVLGNNAPSIIDFAELGERGAIKYRYASMLGTQVQTFQKYYASTEDINKIQSILEIVFRKQLGKLYDAKIQETVNLLEYYDFNPKYATSVRTRVEELTQTKADIEEISLCGNKIPNVCFFYEKNLQNLKEISLPRYISYLHGDLNGANIIIDAHENVWLIDFFHVHRGHILKDLVKLENDILYIFMKIENQKEWEEATELVDLLINTEDLRNSLPNSTVQFTNSKIQKSLSVIKVLRSFYSELIELDRDPYQLWVAQMPVSYTHL
ncbi:MAG: isochorismatase, partial [Leptospiraceae bacterium]|nr:isochorismatase [Leptospiraceae bacterium]